MSGIIGAVFLVTLAEGLFAFLGAAAGHYWKKVKR